MMTVCWLVESHFSVVKIVCRVWVPLLFCEDSSWRELKCLAYARFLNVMGAGKWQA